MGLMRQNRHVKTSQFICIKSSTLLSSLMSLALSTSRHKFLLCLLSLDITTSRWKWMTSACFVMCVAAGVSAVWGSIFMSPSTPCTSVFAFLRVSSDVSFSGIYSWKGVKKQAQLFSWNNYWTNLFLSQETTLKQVVIWEQLMIHHQLCRHKVLPTSTWGTLLKKCYVRSESGR